MTEIYCTKCKRYKKLKKLNISYVFYKALHLFSIYNKCGSEDEKKLKEEEPIKY